MNSKINMTTVALLTIVVTPIFLPSPAGVHADEPDAATREGWQRMASLGDGFVVWESSRSGNWRIWRRELDGSGLRQLTPDETGRDHFCPHISPDGKRLAYLSFPAGTHTYQKHKDVTLRLINCDATSDKLIGPDARAYFEDRAVVWLDAENLVFIDGGGVTQQLNLASGTSEPLTQSGEKEYGFLINCTKTYATNGRPTFSVYDAGSQKIASRQQQGGCQPYFARDGVWGFWMGGAGGPINRFNLATGDISPIILKTDARMPKDRSYLYFPMLSPCQRLFAFAASPGQHDHFTSDYDIFISAIDPRSLELIGEPVRYSFDPKCDRFPDVYLSDLELGEFVGEAPHALTLSVAEMNGQWSWDFGDGAMATSSQGDHTYTAPGRYEVVARQGERELRGRVVIQPASAPKPVSVLVRSGTEIEVRFDEPINLRSPQVRLAGGTRIVKGRKGEDGLSIVLTLAEKLSAADKLYLSGIVDQAQTPNEIEPQTLEVKQRAWPTNPEGLVFLFETNNKPNLVGEGKSYGVTRRGLATLNHDHAMIPGGGSFSVPEVDNDLQAACLATNELTIEATIRPDSVEQTGPARIVTFSSNSSSRNFTLGQEGDKLVLRLRTPKTGDNGTSPQVELCTLAAGQSHHVIVTCRPGEVVAYLNGEQVTKTSAVQGDFSNWSLQHLLFGDEVEGGRAWSGTLEGVAIYNRFVDGKEAMFNAAAYQDLVASRPHVPRARVNSTLVAKSKIPALEDIKPYREALVVYKYRVEGGSYDGKEVLVAHWAILDGKTLPAADRQIGSKWQLDLERFEDNSQLASHRCADDFDSDDDLIARRYFDVAR